MDQNSGFLAFQTSPGVQGVGHRWLACGHEPFKKFMPGENKRPAALRRLDDDGQGARRAGEKALEAFARNYRKDEPSSTSRPWQDRRTLI
jgi:hypothetical protein